MGKQLNEKTKCKFCKKFVMGNDILYHKFDCEFALIKPTKASDSEEIVEGKKLYKFEIFNQSWSDECVVLIADNLEQAFERLEKEHGYIYHSQPYLNGDERVKCLSDGVYEFPLTEILSFCFNYD